MDPSDTTYTNSIVFLQKDASVVNTNTFYCSQSRLDISDTFKTLLKIDSKMSSFDHFLVKNSKTYITPNLPLEFNLKNIPVGSQFF